MNYSLNCDVKPKKISKTDKSVESSIENVRKSSFNQFHYQMRWSRCFIVVMQLD